MTAPRSDTSSDPMLESLWLIVPVPKSGASSKPPRNAHDADDHIEDDALLVVRLHDDAGEPAQDADNEPEDEVMRAP